MLFTLCTHELYVGRNYIARRFGIERAGPCRDLCLLLGRWCVIHSKAPPQ
jgi:hypothetical protein